MTEDTKMLRFLNTLHLDDIESFDLRFEYARRNDIDRNQVDMCIIKSTPWGYRYLEQFINGLSYINYKYTLSFKYDSQPTSEDIFNLFDSWQYTKAFFPVRISYEQVDNDFHFTVEDEDELIKYQDLIDDFKELLTFICYKTNIDLVVRNQEKDDLLAAVEELQNNGVNVDNIPETQVIDSDTNNDSCMLEENIPQEEVQVDEPDETIHEEKQTPEHKEESSKLDQDIVDFEKAYIQAAYDHLREMEEQRKNQLLWKKGDYIFYDDLTKINPDVGNVDINGEIFAIGDARKTKKGSTFRTFAIWSNGSAITCKVFESGKAITKDKINALSPNTFYRVRGAATIDKFSGETNIMVHFLDELPKPALREDPSEEKRVELHLHTVMSNMDGVGTIDEYCAVAKNMGHKAIAVTDHGVCQGFPAAQDAAKKYGLKILYGSELYMVNDELPFGLNPSDREILNATYVCFDLETTGLSARYDRIIEFGAVRYERGLATESLDIMIDPKMPIPVKVQNLTKITQSMVNGQPTIEETIDKILAFFGDAIVVSHNINFDIGFLNESLRRMGREPVKNPCIDTLSLSRYMFPESRNHKLGTLSRNLELTVYNEDEAHRADFDAKALGDVWVEMLSRLTSGGKEHMTHRELSEIKASDILVKHLRPDHVTVLIKNRAGMQALYELISDSHVKYLADVPKTPKREIVRLRENLLVGSGCVNGDVFEAARTRSRDILKEKEKFYDFIEVQPPENYSFLIKAGREENIETIQKYIKDIIDVADELGIPVCATGDCHYVNPSDKIFRDVYVCAPAVGGKLHPLIHRESQTLAYSIAPEQHYRSTMEMLEAFSFLGEEKAKEIVIKNTNAIADLIEDFKPIGKVLNKPEIPNAPETLTKICFDTAKELYGDPLPEFIEDRLHRELSGICDNGYAVTYSIAREIIRRANNDGYMVGSRGSVGSSFAATVFGITEVNPLPPHYRCPHCKHLEWPDPIANKSGYDLPDKVCPVCGTKMIGDGQNIPFATFLGFNAEKIPDIDLNFPSDYQQRAFDSTKDIFGPHNVFRAGTIGTVEEKTAMGYVKGYFEKTLGIDIKAGENVLDKVSRNKISYIAGKCVGVKRTTGQHAGGVMILPKGRSIYEFTPTQYPADDKTSTWLTTHYEYRAIHDSLLKLDLLGHVDPLALRLMSELTGIDVKTIPMNDKRIISIFYSPEALEMKSNFLNAKTGSLAIPEFGTNTAIQTLIETQPRSFADLVKISGLSHGTGVWAGNAESLITSGEKTLGEVIGCRDEIMTQLIEWGIPNKDAFKIMEFVRKGGPTKKPGEWPAFKQLLIDHNVAQWYIDSCEKIEYMFPKAHAVAYVTQAVRVAYFKVYYPLEFYSVWFTARAKAYEIETMLKGLDAIENRYKELQAKAASRTESLTPKEEGLVAMFRIAIEMHERGYKFENIDLYKSKATEFVVDHENKALICSFIAMDGLGESAAESVVEARKDGKFTSQENLLKRTKLSQTIVKDLEKIGALNGLGESEQLSLFEFSF